MQVDQFLVNEIRTASRTMVRELGFMNTTLAETQYSPSAVHTLLEIEKNREMTAAELVHALGLEKSSVSRMLSKLVRAGELEEDSSSNDGRSKKLFLTDKGKNTVAKIHQYGSLQVEHALQVLNPTQQQAVVQGLKEYAKALQIYRLGTEEKMNNTIAIHAGYTPGVVGRIAEMHANFYSKHSGFGQFFESQVASGVADFVGRLDISKNQIWVAILNGRIVGSVAIDGQDLGNNTAHLRWFILDDGCRGNGVGRKLLQSAIEFCDQKMFDETHLWTFKGLDAARKLYESCGFVLTEEESGKQWGSVVTEQKFSRVRPV